VGRVTDTKREAVTWDDLGGRAVEELQGKLTVSVRELAPRLGCSTDALYEAIANGTYPWKVLHIGRRILLPTAPIVRDLMGRGDDC
jgi:hypothetical protein